MINILFGTIEADCWSRSLGYEDYKHYAEQQGTTVLHKPAYEKFCEAMTLQMEISCGGKDDKHLSDN